MLHRLRLAMNWLQTRGPAYLAAPGLAGVLTLAGLAILALALKLWWVALVAVLVLAGAAAGWHWRYRRRAASLADREARLPQATRIEQIDAELENRRQRLDDLQKQVTDAESLLQRKQEAQHWLEENEARLETVEQERQQQRELEADRDRLRQQIEADTKRVQALSRKIGTLEGRRDQAEQRVTEIQQQLDQNEQQRDSLQREVETLESRRKQLAGEISDLEDKQRQRQELRQTLDTLTDERDSLQQQRDETQRQRDHYHDEVQRLRERAEQLESRVNEASDRVESLEARRKQLNNEVSDLEDQRRQRDELRQQITGLATERDTIQQARDQYQRQRDANQAEADRLQQRVDELQARADEAQQTVESLEAKRKRLVSDISDLEAKQQQRDALHETIESLTQQRDTAQQHRDDYARQRDQYHDQAERLQQRVDELEAQASDAKERVESLEQRRAALNTEVAELETTAKRHETLSEEVRQMADRHATLSEQVAADETKQHQLSEQLQQIKSELESTQQTVQQLRDEHQQLTDQRNALSSEVAELESTSKRFNELQQRVESLESRNAELSPQVTNLETELTDKQQRRDQLDSQLQQTKSELDRLQQQVETLETRHRSLSVEASESEALRDQRAEEARELKDEIAQKQSELQTLRDQLESQRAERRELTEEVEGLGARKAQTEQTIQVLDETLKEMRLQQGYRGSNAGPLSELWKPALPVDAFTGPGENAELASLTQMQQHLAGAGLYYADRTLRAFHTAMKVQDHSPLCVLAGLSGTGKSELARRYAEGMGMHFLNLAVQPRWDDPQDMFGFFNYLENQYRATELARALVQMDPFAGEEGRGWNLPEGWDHSLSNRMLVVLLDEMNLAHVEYYFSEFLSRLELRRGINKHDPNDRQQAELALEIGAHGAGEPTMRLFVDANVLFVGTINEDETTQTLSDKVIDRSNMLSFAAPSRLNRALAGSAANGSAGSRDGNGQAPTRPDRYLPYQHWRHWIQPPDAWQGEASEQVNQWIDQLNQAMGLIQRPLAYRTYSAMRAYACNYPDQSETGLRHAVADQIEQKILPRFRGMDPTEQAVGGALEQIVSLAEELDDRPLVEAIEQSRDQGARQYHFTFLGLDRSAEPNQSASENKTEAQYEPAGDKGASQSAQSTDSVY